ncbi:hypothetical protein CPB85DRAFT_1258024 [Mucidula mucida]|nr:hypothetical protein CPB85DRAFT_1258024 [Mucidula mucida]
MPSSKKKNIPSEDVPSPAPTTGKSSKKKGKNKNKEPQEPTRKSSRLHTSGIESVTAMEEPRVETEPHRGSQPEVVPRTEDVLQTTEQWVNATENNETTTMAMSRLYKSYSEEPANERSDSLQEQIAFYENYSLVRNDVIQRKSNKPSKLPAFRLQPIFLDSVDDIVQSLQEHLDQAASVSEISQSWKIDPTGLYSQTINYGANDYQTLVAAWNTLASRLGRGRRFLERYYQDVIPSVENPVPLSPLSTNPDLHREIEHELTTASKLHAAYAKIPSLNRSLSDTERKALIKGEYRWDRLLSIDESFKELEEVTASPSKRSFPPYNPLFYAGPSGLHGILEGDEWDDEEEGFTGEPEPSLNYSFNMSTAGTKFKPKKNFFSGPMGQFSTPRSKTEDDSKSPWNSGRENPRTTGPNPSRRFTSNSETPRTTGTGALPRRNSTSSQQAPPPSSDPPRRNEPDKQAESQEHHRDLTAVVDQICMHPYPRHQGTLHWALLQHPFPVLQDIRPQALLILRDAQQLLRILPVLHTEELPVIVGLLLHQMIRLPQTHPLNRVPRLQIIKGEVPEVIEDIGVVEDIEDTKEKEDYKVEWVPEADTGTEEMTVLPDHQGPQRQLLHQISQ